MNLNIVTTGAVVGFAVQNPRNAILFLLVPVVSSALGLLYADHGRSITLMAAYIDERMRLRRGGEDVRLFPWEDYSRNEVDKEKFFQKYKIAVTLVFVLPPALALVYLRTDGRLGQVFLEVAWTCGLVLSLYMSIMIWRTDFKPKRSAAKS